MKTLVVRPLTAESFTPFGEVIEETSGSSNDNPDKPDRRFNDLAELDAGTDGKLILSLLRMRTTIKPPYCLTRLERHPLGSQLFIPCEPTRFLIVVTDGGMLPDLNKLIAFMTNGHQGVNYRKGVWHAPMSTLTATNFMMLDRSGPGENCDVFSLKDANILVALPQSLGQLCIS